MNPNNPTVAEYFGIPSAWAMLSNSERRRCAKMTKEEIRATRYRLTLNALQ